MRFTVRMLMFVTAAIALGVGVPVGRYYANNREAALAREIGWHTPFYAARNAKFIAGKKLLGHQI